MATFKERFNQLFTEANKPQRDFGEQFGASNDQVYNWRHGRGEPDSETMKRIATICGVSIDYLIGHTDERQPGTNFKTINNPTVLNFVKMIASELQLNNNLSEKDCQEILEDLTEYSRFKLQQKIKNHHVNHS